MSSLAEVEQPNGIVTPHGGSSYWVVHGSLPLAYTQGVLSERHPVEDGLIVGDLGFFVAFLARWLGAFPDVVIWFYRPVVLRVCRVCSPFVVFQCGGLGALDGNSDVFGQIVNLAPFGCPNVCNLVAASVDLLLPSFVVISCLVAGYPA